VGRTSASGHGRVRIAARMSSSNGSNNTIKMSTLPWSHKTEKELLVKKLFKAKEASGKTFTEIAKECNTTNVLCAQIFHGQARLSDAVEPKLRKSVPQLDDEVIQEIKKAPNRNFDPNLIQEPIVYRLYEVIMHYGEAIKALMNEECGDGIMSGINFNMDLDTTVNSSGQKRVIMTFDGAFLPYSKQEKGDDKDAMAFAKKKICEGGIVVFAKTHCPYSQKAKILLVNLGVSFTPIDLDVMSNGPEIQAALAQISGRKTVPNIFIGGENIGGCDELHKLHDNGLLMEKLAGNAKS